MTFDQLTPNPSPCKPCVLSYDTVGEDQSVMARCKNCGETWVERFDPDDPEHASYFERVA